jgi:predicted transcriptional regulator YheO
MNLKDTIPIAKAIEVLLHPYAEVVIHNLGTNKVTAIFNNFSRRKVGSDSLLDASELQAIRKAGLNNDVIGPYEKINWDGRTLKSISVVLRNEQGKPSGLLCINIDTSQFQELQQTLNLFMEPNSLVAQPTALFKDDWQERINQYVHSLLQKRKKTLKTITREEKQELVLLLEQEGAFKGKNAASYIGKLLGLSRATVYNCLASK